jgi:hypothetical protein
VTTLSFESWRRKFEQIRRGKPAWNAFQAMVDHLTKLKESESGDKPQWLRTFDADRDLDWSVDARAYVLRRIYMLTLPPPTYSESKLKQDAYTRRALAKLTKEAESFVTHLQKTSVWVTNNARERYEIDLSPVLQAYKTAAGYSGEFLRLLEMPYTRKPAFFEGFLGFVSFLDWFAVPERESLELLRFALLTHGYTEDQLDQSLDRDKIREGLYRKRKQAGKRRVISFLDLALGGDGKQNTSKAPRIVFSVRKNQHPK